MEKSKFTVCANKYIDRLQEEAYREYQSALRHFNDNLKKLARQLHIPSVVTSYSLRYSWATTAKYRGVLLK